MSIAARHRPALVNAQELLHLNGSERCQLVHGELQPMPPPPGWVHGSLTQLVAVLVGSFIEQNELGTCFTAETGFHISVNPDTVIAPDWAFISRDRMPVSMPAGYGTVAPDIVLETRSPSESAPSVAMKIGLWLDAGVQRVWELDPKRRTLSIHEAGKPVRLLGEAGVLTDPMLPGFSLPLSRILDRFSL